MESHKSHPVKEQDDESKLTNQTGPPPANQPKTSIERVRAFQARKKQKASASDCVPDFPGP